METEPILNVNHDINRNKETLCCLEKRAESLNRGKSR